MEHPIDRIEWVDVDQLDANDYNPNHVLKQEMDLLALSLMKQGWIQPILVSWDVKRNRGTIIDGFHRATLAKTHKRVREMTGGKVPVCKLELSEPERILLTIRINRAKGNHAAIRMSECVKQLVAEYGYSPETIAQGIGAAPGEVDLLLMQDVFKALDVENARYSQAWVPKR